MGALVGDLFDMILNKHTRQWRPSQEDRSGARLVVFFLLFYYLFVSVSELVVIKSGDNLKKKTVNQSE